jgi:hypothetical protein
VKISKHDREEWKKLAVELKASPTSSAPFRAGYAIEILLTELERAEAAAQSPQPETKGPENDSRPS